MEAPPLSDNERTRRMCVLLPLAPLRLLRPSAEMCTYPRNGSAGAHATIPRVNNSLVPSTQRVLGLAAELPPPLLSGWEPSEVRRNARRTSRTRVSRRAPPASVNHASRILLLNLPASQMSFCEGHSSSDRRRGWGRVGPSPSPALTLVQKTSQNTREAGAFPTPAIKRSEFPLDFFGTDRAVSQQPSALYCWILEILYCNPKGRRALLRVPSTVGRSVCLCWAHL